MNVSCDLALGESPSFSPVATALWASFTDTDKPSPGLNSTSNGDFPNKTPFSPGLSSV